MGVALALALVLGLTAGRSQNVVTNCTDSALRSAITQGGRFTFACDGTLALASPITVALDTQLDASGHQVTIDGSHTLRLFQVATNVTLTLVNLTLANGSCTNGGAVLNTGGTVNVTNCLFSGHIALGETGAEAEGGAFFNTGNFNASQCIFVGNSAQGGSGASQPGTIGAPGGAGRGGAIFNSGNLLLDRCLFASNSVSGGYGGCGTSASYYDSPFARATGGSSGGPGSGSAIHNIGAAALINCTLAWNLGTGGPGGFGGAWSGPSPYADFGTPGGLGAAALGVVCAAAGEVTLTNCTLALNFSQGGGGGAGGAANIPGPGGGGGDAVGGICNNGGAVSLVNCLLAFNSGLGAQGGYGATGDREHLVYGEGPQGIGAGNFTGAITDAGHNLSSDTSEPLPGPGSRTGAAPGLGPLADNGGPSWTMALLPNSPAIDTADTSWAPPVDQRGFARPFGPAADIGAFELYYPALLRADRSTLTGINILVSGANGQAFCLLASTNLANWAPVATNQIGANGTCLFHAESPAGASEFYRVRLP